MGVAGLLNWLERKFRTSFRLVDGTAKDSIEVVYYDLLDLVHSVVRSIRTPNESQVLLRICEELEEKLSEFNNCKTVYLALDGVAPAAKHKVQKDRRYKSQGDYFESIQITPGTLFMEQLHTALLWVGHKLLQRPGAPRLYLSLSSMPGEAEIKLFDPCLPHTATGPALLATSDSDCILVGLLFEPLRYVLLRQYQLVDLAVVRAEIAREFAFCLPTEAAPARLHLDLCFLALFSGNDYLPPHDDVGLSCWGTYKELKEENPGEWLVSAEAEGAGWRLQLNHSFLAFFLDMLGAGEGPTEGAWSAELYLDALLWNLDLYKNRRCRNYGFTYGHALAPSLAALQAFLAGLPPRESVPKRQRVEKAAAEPLSAELLCLKILPLSAASFLPPHVAAVMQQHAELYSERAVDSSDLEQFRDLLDSQRPAAPPGTVDLAGWISLQGASAAPAYPLALPPLFPELDFKTPVLVASVPS